MFFVGCVVMGISALTIIIGLIIILIDDYNNNFRF